MKDTENQRGNGGVIAAAAAIRVAGEPAGAWEDPGLFSQPLVGRAAALLMFASAVSGGLSILYANKFIGVTTKDCLVGSYYAIMFAGALRVAGKLDVKRAALLVANTVAFQTWNSFFFFTPRLAVFILVIAMWLPLYWLREMPGVMKEMGFAKKGMFSHLFYGLLIGAVTLVYFAWAMKNYGFKMKAEPWSLIVNSAQTLPMYISIFCFFHIVWRRLKKSGLSPISLLSALGVLSVSMNAPVFLAVGASTGTPPGTYIAGFAATTCVMALVTHFTFKRFGSALPAACLFTVMSALLLLSGLV